MSMYLNFPDGAKGKEPLAAARPARSYEVYLTLARRHGQDRKYVPPESQPGVLSGGAPTP